MKIRSGFVSNSSSSSFLIVGIEKNKLSEEQIKLAENAGLEDCWTSSPEDCTNDDDNAIVGKEWHASEEDVEDFSATLVVNTVEKIKDILGDKANIRVYMGVKYG